jgi:hypothetical protein
MKIKALETIKQVIDAGHLVKIDGDRITLSTDDMGWYEIGGIEGLKNDDWFLVESWDELVKLLDKNYK